MTGTDEEKLPLAKAGHFLLDECRMVLPGIQALFGFQLIAVFNERFDGLEPHLKLIHLGATVLVAASVALVMAPAAYHRQRCLHHVDDAFLVLSTRLLLAAMFPLWLAIALEIFVVASLIVKVAAAVTVAALVALFIAALWFVLPRLPRGT